MEQGEAPRDACARCSLRIFSAIDAAIDTAEDEVSLLRAVCRVLVDDGYAAAWVGMLHGNEPRASAKVACCGADPEEWPAPDAVLAGEVVVSPGIVGLPLRARRRVMGVLWIRTGGREAFEEDELTILREVASRVACAVSSHRARTETQRLNAELERRVAERAAALKEKDVQMREFFDNSSDLMCATDADLHIVNVNRAWCEALGYTPEDAQHLTTFDIIDPSDAADVRRGIDALRVDPSTALQIERVLVTKSGAHIHVEGTLGARVEDGKVSGLRVFLRDVTTQRRAENELRRSRDELRAANVALERASRAKDEFLASMSHELRTPLNAVLGLSEALEEDVYGPLNERQLATVRRVAASGRHLLELINDILDLSKVGAGKMSLDLAPVGVGEVCRASLELIQEPARKKGLHVLYQVRQGIGTIRADSRRLMQILVNLLSNAVKFTPEGGTLGLEVSADDVAGTVRFEVWDTGIGIAPEHVGRLFQPFVQLDSSLSRRHPGTGLGLALVQGLVGLHGGRVEVDTQLGMGSRFTVSLPGYEAPASNRPKTLCSHRPGQPAVALGTPRKRRVLLVEDEETNIFAVGEYLKSKGYDVRVARSGREAVTVAREDPPDVILMDIQMPDMDGLAATREIRADPRQALREVPIVALTALAMVGDRERCLAAGADDYLTKPVPLRKLVEVIEGRCAHV